MKTAITSVAIFILNAIVCAPLFRVEYLDQFRSNEGAFMTFGEFLARYWPHAGWFPWFDAGMPFENAYLPLIPVLVAVVSRVAHCSAAHALHFLAALTYSLAPVFLFLFARALSGRIAPSAWAAMLWSLISPAIIFPVLLHELGTPWGIRRLQNIVVWGEIPHNVALCLLPLALWLMLRFFDRPSPRRFAIAALCAAAMMLTNAFGIAVLGISAVFLVAALGKHFLRELLWLGGIFVAAYLAICWQLPPRLLRLMEINAQSSGGDFRFTLSTRIAGLCLLVALALVWILLRRYARPALQFAALFSLCFGAITALSFYGLNILPQGERYHVEFEAGVCLLAVFAIEPLAQRMPRKISLAGAALCAIALAWIAAHDFRFARRIIHPADTANALEFQEARWIAANLPGERVLDAADGQWLFNLFAGNPQLSAGHEPSAPNHLQQVAVYTIYTGTNAGAEDGPISVLWLKAFGCGAVVVPGPASKDYYHAILNPGKFEGLLPVLWRQAGDTIYRVPQRSSSLAHVIPRDALVSRRPIHGLDVAPLRPYVAALDDPAASIASLTWKDPEHGKIAAAMQPSDVITVQMTYDPGWQAHVAGKAVGLRADQLGFIEIDPQCAGDCSIDLVFQGGRERTVTFAISSIATLVLLAMILIDARFRKIR